MIYRAIFGLRRAWVLGCDPFQERILFCDKSLSCLSKISCCGIQYMLDTADRFCLMRRNGCVWLLGSTAQNSRIRFLCQHLVLVDWQRTSLTSWTTSAPSASASSEPSTFQVPSAVCVTEATSRQTLLYTLQSKYLWNLFVGEVAFERDPEHGTFCLDLISPSLVIRASKYDKTWLISKACWVFILDFHPLTKCFDLA